MRLVVGEGSCGLAAGAGAVYQQLEELLAQGNEAGVELGITGCNGMCFLEPIVDLYDDEGALHRLVKVQAKDAKAIYEAATTGNLSLVDKLILLDIYPAREEPIPGVTSEIIFKDVTAPEKVLIKKEQLMDYLSEEPLDVLVTFGAGNVDRFIEPITEMLNKRLSGN